ncbi:MAG: glycosyltransferase family 39 protein [Chloroflexi bacterium]|nr:glycosyltransferase family 39 protein [Chloroflexota bacterium]
MSSPADRSPRPASFPDIGAALVLAGLAQAALGAYLLSLDGPPLASLAVAILGSLETLVGALALKHIATRLARLAAWVGVSATQALAIANGLVLAMAARAAAGDGPLVLSPLATPLWLAGIALVVWGCSRRGEASAVRRWTRLEIAAVGLLALAAFIVRAWDLGHMPFVLSGDEGSAGLTAWEFRTGARDNVLSLGWFSFPSFYFALLSLGQLIFGRTTEAIRIVSAFAGALTIPALYALAREMLSRPAAFAAAAWLAAFHVHVFFSRLAYNNIFDGLLLILAAGGLWRGWQSGERRAFLITGLTLGLSQFFYTTGRLTPILLALWLALLALHRRPDRARLAGLTSMLLAGAAVLLPLGLLYVAHPYELFFTASRVSILIPGWTAEAAAALGTSASGLVVEQIWVTALGLTVGELQGIYYASGAPLLISLSGVLFFGGLALCLARFKQPRFSLWLLILAGTILAGGLSIQAPNSQRLLYLAPALAMLVVLPLEQAWIWAVAHWVRGRSAVLVSGAILLAVMMAQNLDLLFVRYFPREEYGSLNGAVTQEMIAILPAFPDETKVYFFGGERMGFASIPSLAYLLPDAAATDADSAQDVPADATGLLAIVLPEQAPVLTKLERRFPEGAGMRRYNRFGRVLFDLWAVGEAAAALPSISP